MICYIHYCTEDSRELFYCVITPKIIFTSFTSSDIYLDKEKKKFVSSTAVNFFFSAISEYLSLASTSPE
jgi:hypothetical protein